MPKQTTRQTSAPLWHYQCPECGFGDEDTGYHAPTDVIYCEICLEDTLHVRLKRWQTEEAAAEEAAKKPCWPPSPTPTPGFGEPLQLQQPAMRPFLDFEKSIAELEGKIDELRHLQEPGGINIAEEIARLTEKADKQLRATYAKLTPWQKTQVARHPDRPKALAYLRALLTDLTPLAGDRAFAEDAAVVGGLGRFGGRPVVAIGTEKGEDTEGRVRHNFGMAKPEGYRKARRLIELAGQFGLPVLTFVDTAGAFPGVEAEARGQAEAIARSIEACLQAPVPIVATVIGEGGSGGAIALAAGDRVLMLEHAIYSVISPEGCASILWRDASQAATAAEALRLTAEDLRSLRLVDTVIGEPIGGAHRDPAATIASVAEAVRMALAGLDGQDGPTLMSRRREKYLAMGREAMGL